MWTFVILHSLNVFLCTHAPSYRNLTLAAMWPPSGFTCPLKPWCLPAVTFLSRHPKPTSPSPALHHCEFPPYLCLCLMGSPCFGSIADVVQSHGGVFMDSSYPSSPVTGPLSRGQRRASEVSIASQVSGMADSYTASNIANSKCSQHQPASFSLFLALTQTLVVTLLLPLSLHLTFLPVFSLFFRLSSFIFSLNPPPPRYSHSTHTPRHSWSSLLSLIDVNSPLLFFFFYILCSAQRNTCIYNEAVSW